jgi:hypothetical protein
VGVGIHEAGQHAAPSCIEDFVGPAESVLMFLLVTDENDSVILAPYDGVREHLQVGERRTAPRAITGRGDDLVGAPDEETHPPFSVFFTSGRWKAAS